MRFVIVAAFALAAASSLNAQPTAGTVDLAYATPIGGAWTYAPTSGGSQASFVNATGLPQVIIRCTRLTRRVAIIKNAPAPISTLWVWTSSQARTLPASFNTATGQAIAELPAFDGLLDAVAASRGRIGFSTPGVAALVVPPWSEVGRVIEDCRV